MSSTTELTRLDQARQNVTLRQLELEKAQKELTAAQREEDVANWKQVRDELRAATKEFEDLKAEFVVANEAAMPADNAMMRERSRLEAHRANRPEEFDEESVVAGWREQDARLSAAFTQAREAYSAAEARREQLRLAVVKAGVRVDGLTFAERNAREKARGAQAAQGWKGGLARV